MSTLFFIHVPKTGGTSIRYAARDQFRPEQMLMLYGRKSQWNSPAATAIVHHRPDLTFRQRMAALSDYIETNDIAFFASHLPAWQLPCFKPECAFTILRDPVERVISEYYFFRKKGRTDVSLETFIELPKHRNAQYRKVAKVSLESLAVVGVLENFGSFLERLNARFGLRFAVAHEQRGGLIRQLHSKLIGNDMRRRIETLNTEDMTVYRQALEIAQR